ncbi:MAG: HIT domain-containing protein [Actinomycetota bacterium]|nr:HIT domain-containing protein [Actinomycetota bacterium]
MTTHPDCVFCSIVAGEVPAEVVHSSDHNVAFRDLDPQAPTHVLVVPRRHVADIGSLVATAPDEAAALLADCWAVADLEGMGNAYRLVFNTGAAAGQSVVHAHGHVLAGRDLGWPPG